MTYRNEPSADEMEAAAVAGMSAGDRAQWAAMKALRSKLRRRRSKHGPEEDRMVKGPVEDRGRKRGRRT